MACELADVAVCPRRAFVVNIKYLQENQMLPYIQPDAEAEVPVHAGMRRLLETAEHSGCSAGRCRAILLICEDQSSGCLTDRPRNLPADPTPNPRAPQALRTDFPPPRQELQGFLEPGTGELMTIHLREVLDYLTTRYNQGGHDHPFEAAKQHLQEILHAETSQNLRKRTRSAMEEPSPAEDPDADDQDPAAPAEDPDANDQDPAADAPDADVPDAPGAEPNDQAAG